MEKKYYDLISSLIENHKKYSEYSAIREEIIEHIYEQAKTVIDTVNDDRVIEGYLTKIITSAFITVPKKLGYNVKQRQNFGDTFIIPANGTERTRKNIETAVDSNLIESNETETEALEAVEDSEDLIDIELTAETNQEEIIEKISLEPDTVDKSLVDKMINGVSLEEVPIESENTEDSFDSNVTEIYDSLDEIENITEDNIEEEENNEIETEDDTIELDLDAPDDFLNLNVDEIIIQEEIEEKNDIEIIESDVDEPAIEEEIIETDEQYNLDNAVLNDGAEMLDTNIDDSTIEETSLLDVVDNDFEALTTEEIIDEEPVLEITNELEVENLEEFESLEVEEVDEILEVTNDTLDADIEPETTEVVAEQDSCYSFFKFDPATKEVDADEILTSLKDLDQKYPEKQILEIVELKYNKKLSIAEVAEKTGLTINEIISTLNEVVDVIKD